MTLSIGFDLTQCACAHDMSYRLISGTQCFHSYWNKNASVKEGAVFMVLSVFWLTCLSHTVLSSYDVTVSGRVGYKYLQLTEGGANQRSAVLLPMLFTKVALSLGITVRTFVAKIVLNQSNMTEAEISAFDKAPTWVLSHFDDSLRVVNILQVTL